MNPSIAVFARSLEAIPLALEAKLALALYRGVHAIAEDMRADVPVKTGTLRDSIDVEVVGPLHLRITAGGDATTKDYAGRASYEREVRIDGRSNRGIAKQKNGAGVTYDYALAVEYGTSKMQAQPFFWPAYQRGSRKLLSDMARSVVMALR